MPGRVCAECAALIIAERQFNPRDPVVRLFDAWLSLSSLPGFLNPTWLPTDAAERRLHYDGLIDLAGMMLDDGLVDEDEFKLFTAELSRAAWSQS